MDILIVGAGPTGLTAALELQRLGANVRIIEKRPDASGLSRAVGILPQSMALLEPSGVTAKILEEAIIVKRANFLKGEKTLLQIDVGIDEKYGHIYGLPQDRTEDMMREVLEAGGHHVEFGKALKSFQDHGNCVEAQFGDETAKFDYLVGADGIGSLVRQSLDIAYKGMTVEREWSIADFTSRTWPYQDEVAVWVTNSQNVYFVIPIAPARFRLLSDVHEAAKHMPVDTKIDSFNRTGNFTIQVRQAETYQKGRVYLAGDAAHCHSPVGGRGMNLGIEDATDLAQRLVDGGTEGYSAARHAAGEEVIKFSERGRKFMTESNPSLRNLVIRTIGHLPKATLDKVANKQLLNISTSARRRP